ncbi:unnamed protein product [Diamesa serratosioi]
MPKSNKVNDHDNHNDDEFNLDSLLDEIKFGKYQMFIFVLIAFPIALNGIFSSSYIFTAGNLNYRCHKVFKLYLLSNNFLSIFMATFRCSIPECDTTREYNPQWLNNTTPLDQFSNLPKKCEKYETRLGSEGCLMSSFDQTSVQKCNQDFIYEDPKEITILNEFNLTCDENEYKLSLIGTINNIGQLFCYLITGYLSDRCVIIIHFIFHTHNFNLINLHIRYGRKFVIVVGCFGSGLFGILRAFSGSYVQFALFEFLDAFFGAATYSSAFIIGLELVTAKRRAVSGTFLNCFYAIGEIYLGIIAYYFRNFRTILLIIYLPAVLTISYIAVLPRSVRWLLAKNRNQEAKKILLKAAKINGTTLTTESLKQLDEKVEQERVKKQEEITLSSSGQKVHNDKQSINAAIVFKVANLCFCWFANTFVYNGLNLNSVYLNLFDKYFSYILVCSVEIPAFFATNFLMDWIGRKKTLFLGLFGSGLSCVIGELFAAVPQAPRHKYQLNRPLRFNERNGRIVGGRDATIEEFPYMVALFYRNFHTCGGAILNANTILSAAHCTNGRAASSFSVRVGSNRVTTGGQVVNVRQLIPHEWYNPRNEEFDIVILKLERNLVLSASVRAIQLPTHGFNVPHAAMATVSGWGGTNTAGNRVPTVLQTLQTPIIGNTQCRSIIGSSILNNHICAGGVVGRDACYGDSGGPLVFQGRVVGIVSWGPGRDCAVGWPIVYMRVSELLPFIIRNIRHYPEHMYKVRPELANLERSGRIVGGRDATIEEFPFMVSLIWFGGHTCGGSVLNAQTILSAAHCTHGEHPTSFSVRVGSSRVGTGGQLVRVWRVHGHDFYDDTIWINDISILKLERHLVLSASVRAIQLPTQGFNVPHAVMATVSGWGGTNTAGNRSPTVLQTLQTPVIGNPQCRTIIGSSILNTHICAGGVVGRDACYGDSGGPLVLQGRIVGIVSWGPGSDCAVGWPNVYTRVSEHLPFIKFAIKAQTSELNIPVVIYSHNNKYNISLAVPQRPRHRYELYKPLQDADRTGRIVGGTNTTIEAHPYQIALFYTNRHSCGGAILNTNTILSAAHCTDRSQTEFAVRAGSTFVSSGGQYIKATGYFNHEMYDDFDLSYDITILKLETDLVFSASVRAINLPTATFNVPQDSIATISGWGDLEFRSGNYPEQLQTVQVPVLSNPQCQIVYGNIDIFPNHICAGETGRDACQGDSGGPLTYQGRVIGIVSWGFGCAMDWPTVYSRVSEFLPFILVSNCTLTVKEDKLFNIFQIFTAVPTVPRHKNEFKQPSNNCKKNGRVLGGRNTTIEQHPYQIALFYTEHHLCGGAILNKNTILTAAQCADGRERVFRVRAGSTTMSSGGQFVRVTEYFEHPQFHQFAFFFDVAIMKLAQDLVFSDSVAPINLPPPGFKVPHGSIATVSGWGVLVLHAESYPDHLHAVDLPIVENDKCGHYFEGDINKIIPSHICAGNPCHNALPGDTGGPLVYQGYLIGIVSWGFGFDIDTPTVYARVSEVLPFIRRHM